LAITVFIERRAYHIFHGEKGNPVVDTAFTDPDNAIVQEFAQELVLAPKTFQEFMGMKSGTENFDSDLLSIAVAILDAMVNDTEPPGPEYSPVGNPIRPNPRCPMDRGSEDLSD
jgi:hypothetical protein